MAMYGLFSRVRSFVAVAALSLAALFAIAVGGVAAAAEHLAWPADFVVLDAPASLALDRLNHDLLLNATPPDAAKVLAFVSSAHQHDLFIGDGFALGTAPLLT